MTATPVPAAPQALPVTSALSLGWLLADLTRDVAAPGTPALPGASGLGGPAALDESMLARDPSPTVRVRQIQSKLSQLQPHLDGMGLPKTDSAALRAKISALATELDSQAVGSTSQDNLTTKVEAITDYALANLTVASVRLGRAFGLGFEVANTCRPAPDAHGVQLSELFGARIIDVQEALADLASSLPDHAARGVSLSLAQWQHWAMNPTLSKRPVAWPQEGIANALGRQGKVWRSLPSGEKLGKDMLGTNDYLGALKTLARRLVTGRPWVWLLLGVFVGAVAGGIYLIVAEKTVVAKVGGVILSGLGAVGISTATLKRGFDDVAKEIEAQVWGAEIDFAVAEAITVPPGDWRVKLRRIELPPPRGWDPNIAANSRVVHKLSKEVSRTTGSWGPPRLWRIQQSLHDSFEYHPLGGDQTTKNKPLAFTIFDEPGAHA